MAWWRYLFTDRPLSIFYVYSACNAIFKTVFNISVARSVFELRFSKHLSMYFLTKVQILLSIATASLLITTAALYFVKDLERKSLSNFVLILKKKALVGLTEYWKRRLVEKPTQFQMFSLFLSNFAHVCFPVRLVFPSRTCVSRSDVFFPVGCVFPGRTCFSRSDVLSQLDGLFPIGHLSNFVVCWFSCLCFSLLSKTFLYLAGLS